MTNLYTRLLKAFLGHREAQGAAAPPKAPGKDPVDELPALILRMAQTGEGTDRCLEIGCLPVPVHFYSPIPDIKDLEERKIWERKSKLAGIEFDGDSQSAYLRQIANAYGQECRWPQNRTGNPFQFYTHNGCFSFGCAAALHCMIRYHKPRRLIEVGSGNSSLVISAALERNRQDPPGLGCDYTVIDPYPDETVLKGLPALNRLLKQRVELVPEEFFRDLGKNDILFIDSSHVVKTGSDVNYLILDILPDLAPGVIVHFHDIDLPFEYPKVYATNPAFRMFWTEAYLLQAFLSCNDQWEILVAMGYLMKERMAVFQSAFPHFDVDKNWANSGSFWIKKKGDFVKCASRRYISHRHFVYLSGLVVLWLTGVALKPIVLAFLLPIVKISMTISAPVKSLSRLPGSLSRFIGNFLRFLWSLLRLLGTLVRIRLRSGCRLAANGTDVRMKFVLVCPASSTSSSLAMTINSLIEGVESTRYCLILPQSFDQRELNDLTPLPPPCYILPQEWQIRFLTNHPVIRFVNVCSAVFIRSIRTAQIFTETYPRPVIAGTVDIFDLTATYFAARLANIRFVPCLFDGYPSEAPKTALRSRVGRFLESIVFRKAGHVIVPNDAMKKRIERRYHVVATVLSSRVGEIRDSRDAADQAGLDVLPAVSGIAGKMS